jgi:hypothetical protein
VVIRNYFDYEWKRRLILGNRRNVRRWWRMVDFISIRGEKGGKIPLRLPLSL